MITKIDGQCQFEGCKKPATNIAAGRYRPFDKPGIYCDEHTPIVQDDGAPEYFQDCPNCGCKFGVA